MSFDYNAVYAGKIDPKTKKLYKSTAEHLNKVKAIVDWCIEGNVDFNDIVSVKARFAEHPGWKAETTRGQYLSMLSTFIRLLDTDDLQKLNIRDHDAVLKTYCVNARQGVMEAPQTQNRILKRKRADEEKAWNSQQHNDFVADRKKVAFEHLARGLDKSTDGQKQEFQECVLVVWCKELNNMHAVQHLILKNGYNDRSNFIVRQKVSPFYQPPMYITYNDHKIEFYQGTVVQEISQTECPDLYKLVYALYDMTALPHLFSDLKNNRAFADDDAFRRYLKKCHGNELGARLLRVMSRTDFHINGKSLREMAKSAHENGHPNIFTDMGYAK